MQVAHLDYQITDDVTSLDFARVHSWLTATYWSPGITLEKVQKAARHSAMVVSAWHRKDNSNVQVGYCRVVSDTARFAWLADVYIDSAHRGRGLGRAIVRFALDHPDLADVRFWMLGTQDAQGVYAALGFTPPTHPERLMQLKRPK